MRAAVLYGRRDIRIEEKPDPTPGPDDVVVTVKLNGLCGTDLTEYLHGPLMVPLDRPHPGSKHMGPTILGHEFTGTVTAVGDRATAWLGKRVVCGAGVSCGHCSWCLRGRTNLCASYYTIGLSTHGGLAERVVVPAATLVEVPPQCPDTEAVLAQPLAVGLHAVDRAGLAGDERVVVLGAGAIGSFVLAALAGHRGPILAVDVAETRLTVARELGATEVLRVDRNISAQNFAALFAEPPDVVFECSGSQHAAARALAAVARGGRVVLVGLVKESQMLSLADAVLRELDIRTSVAHVCARDLPRAVQLLAERPLASVIGVRRVQLDKVVADGFVPLSEGVSAKVLVDPTHE